VGPLSGITVIDLSRYGPGRYCAMIFGDLGADVITIEAPRSSLGLHEIMSDDVGFRHLGQNRSKRSIAVDLKQPKGVEIIHSLSQKADVFIETFRPGVVNRLGVDYLTISRINQNIVYCSMTGYGQSGPYAQRPGHDINFAAISGMLGLSGSNNSTPVYLPFQIVDVVGICHATIAILAALFSRNSIKKGQYIDTSMVDGMVFHLWHYAMLYFQSGGPWKRPTLPTGSDISWMNIYKCRDGRYITIACMEPSLWRNTCRALNREDLISRQYGPADDQLKVYEELSSVFITKNRDEWIKLADDDVPIAPVYTLDETFADPHLIYRKATVEIDHPKLGKITLLNTPFKFSETPAEVRRRPPLWAEHTKEILQAHLNFSEEQICSLFEQKVVE